MFRMFGEAVIEDCKHQPSFVKILEQKLVSNSGHNAESRQKLSLTTNNTLTHHKTHLGERTSKFDEGHSGEISFRVHFQISLFKTVHVAHDDQKVWGGLYWQEPATWHVDACVEEEKKKKEGDIFLAIFWYV